MASLAAPRAAALGRRTLLDPPRAAPTSFRGRIAHPGLQTLYDYWLERSGAHGVMPRAALDPVDLPHLLKNLILAEIGDDGRAIRYRLVGTEIVAAHGFDFTGWTIERLLNADALPYARRIYSAVVTRAAPVYSEGRFRWAEKEYRWTKRLHLPLSRHGDGRVDLVLIGQFYERQQGREELVLPARREELAHDRAGRGAGSPPPTPEL